ncbi:signal peptidase I [Candidatus Woesearchaeota archaeon]|nr:signal peptidase I [Candidatus Woesearchaeota archaeon]
MDRLLLLIIICAGLIGWLSHSLAASLAYEIPYSYTTAPERLSPGDRVQEDNIRVYENYAVISGRNLMWARFTNTNSMDPIIDEAANSIETKVTSPEDIQVGDIISYTYNGSIIIHRVVRVDYDAEGWFALVKGDNNPDPDPEKVRFSQIHGVVIGILY